uniref:Uncharacterized protein n=1 Tax=Helianthus annuus TaxID=4232 RepID=A0A251VII1_HELAN
MTTDSLNAKTNFQILILFSACIHGYRLTIINRNSFNLSGLSPPKIHIIKLKLWCSSNPNYCRRNPTGKQVIKYYIFHDSIFISQSLM